jgi:voltage-dependent potassium channel beta subunit
MMEYRRMGRSGLKISALSLGGWTTFGDLVTNPQIARDIITFAYEHGVNFYDIADAYGAGEAERMMGDVLKDFPRHTLVISSKLYFPMSDEVNDRGLSRKHIMESLNKSLKRIGTDYLDIYFCHRYDDNTPVEETARAMDDLVHQGKILYWGTSEWSADQLDEVMTVCEKYNLYKPVVEQPRFSMLRRKRLENEVRPVAEKYGLGIVVFSPLQSGMLTGKYDNGMPEDSRLANVEWLQKHNFKEPWIDAVRQLKPIADSLGITRAQLAMAWTLCQPGISSAITGATKLSQIEDTIKALDIQLDEDVLKQIDRIVSPVTE